MASPLNKRNAFLSNNFSKSMATKTINLLYQTIVGKSSYKKNKKF